VKDYKARVRTDSSAQIVLMQKNQHSHEPDERKNERHQLRATAKRKATDASTTSILLKSTCDVNLLSKLSIIFKEWRVIVLFVL
jgi:hypothetical protein